MKDHLPMIVQAVMTLAMLGYAFLMESRTPGVSSLVVGAAVALWLRESADLSHDRREEAKK